MINKITTVFYSKSTEFSKKYGKIPYLFYLSELMTQVLRFCKKRIILFLKFKIFNRLIFYESGQKKIEIKILPNESSYLFFDEESKFLSFDIINLSL